MASSLPGTNPPPRPLTDGPKGNRLPGLGSDKDEHGCRPSAGEAWCPSTKSCLPVTQTCPPETPKEPGMMGSDKDANGCRPSAGEAWCPSTKSCLSVTQTCPPETPKKKKAGTPQGSYGNVFLLPLLGASLVASFVAAVMPSPTVAMLLGMPLAVGLQSLVLWYWPGEEETEADRAKAMWVGAILVAASGLLAWLVTMRANGVLFGVLFVALLSTGQLLLDRFFADELRANKKEK